MALTSGFFNSLAGDRKYDAEQMGRIFNGVIADGIFAGIGDRFTITATGDRGVIVGTGRAWFDGTWTNNDAPIPFVIPPAESVLDRIDQIVLEVNNSTDVRSNSIKFVTGAPASSPVGASLVKTATVKQYLLATIYVKAGTTTVTQANITNYIGTARTPYVVGVVQNISTDQILAQWNAEFDEWFDSLTVTLSGDVAGNLANEINALETRATTLETDLNHHATTPSPHSPIAGSMFKTDGAQHIATGGPYPYGGPINMRRNWETGGVTYWPKHGGGLVVPETRKYEVTCGVYVSGGGNTGTVSMSVLQWRGDNFVKRVMSSFTVKNTAQDTTKCATNIVDLVAGDAITMAGMISGGVNVYGTSGEQYTYLTIKAL